MKKFTLLAVLFASLATANAQTFTTDKDTSKASWVSSSAPVDVHIKATNTGSSDILIDWKVAAFHMDPGWTFDGVCDNYDCYTTAVPGLIDGTKAFTTDVIHPSTVGDFKFIFIGSDAAANGSQCYATLYLYVGAGPIRSATFIATKTASGIVTTIKKDDDIAIYPNPASNYIDVLYSPNSDVKTIAIYNLIGKVVNVYKVTDKNSARCEFNADMPSGIYLVRIADSKGNVVATRKITHQ